jgi:hypothetical protein
MYITDGIAHLGYHQEVSRRKRRDWCLMPGSFINDPNHWHQRAEEIRILANDMKDEISKQMMLRIAQDYERLAARAEERAKRS